MILSKEEIAFGSTRYDIILSSDFNGLSAELSKIPSISKIFIITERKIARLYSSQLEEELKKLSIPYSFVYMKGKEKNKHIDRLKKIYNKLIEDKIDRKSIIIALGGGVVGDLTGFVASTILRGVRFVQVPTTLLANVDSSVGGKVAVNVDMGKNMVGSFHQPSLVFAPLNTLSTLPNKEWRCGLAEILKHSLLSNSSFLDTIKNATLERIQSDRELLKYCIVESVRYKASIVAQDEKETGLRSVLNLGHTIGHAIESYTQYKKYSHGEAVSIGLVTALLLSQKKQGLEPTIIENALFFMKNTGLPIKESIPIQQLIEHAKHDKKTKGDTIHFVLLKNIGEPVWGIPIAEQEIEEAYHKQLSF